jgi:hypothetical protein
MKRLSLLTAGAVALAICAPSAWSQSTQVGTVSRLHVRGTDGLVYFYVAGPRSPMPGCAIQPYWIVPNESSASAKQQLALLMMAEATGKVVTVVGTGTCSRWPDGESVAEIAVSD